jgi:putative nucleotidyltransferase with HDIG domain
MSEPVDSLRAALAGQEAWIVGGAVRDRLLGRATDDLDVVLAGDVAAAARAMAKATGAAVFSLSKEFGVWRVVDRDREWHVDLLPLKDGNLHADLAARDFTVNAMAEPLAGGAPVDPHGGLADLEARRLRTVSPEAMANDPLRTLRAVRLAVELGFEIEPETLATTRRLAPGLGNVAPERILAEFKRVIRAENPRAAIELLDAAGVTAHVLPELEALRGVEQNVFHHRDVHGHTLEVLDAVAALQRDPAELLGPHAAVVDSLLRQRLADDFTRWDGLRLAALLHDIAKPGTRGELPGGRVTFVGHDRDGADLARTMLRRLRAPERLTEHVAHLTRHHLRLGFLVHEQPLGRRSIYRYLVKTAPYAADVTVLTVADRVATRGKNAEAAIAAHLEVACTMLDHALEGLPAEPLLRGDELAKVLGRPPGPWLGELLERLEEDRFAGEISTREEALERARELAPADSRP